MQKQTSIYIPKPCHEDWNRMTPTQQGKFCSSCNKQVIDFTLMSDNQILNFLSNQQEKLCGRFDAQQLQRPLIETKVKKKKSWWLALTMPFILLFERSDAQQNTSLLGETVHNNKALYSENVHELFLGKIAVNKPSKQKIITGNVIDENNKPIEYATVFIKGTKHATVTNSSGKFLLKMNTNDSITLVVSYIGYETVEKKINLNEIINIQMKIHEEVSSGVVVLAGFVAPSRSVRMVDTLKSSIKKICNISAFKVYPNPVNKENDITVAAKQAGIYDWQLLDNQSALIANGELNIILNNSTSSFTIPSNIASGVYYLCLINPKTKKRNVEKIIIQ